MEMNLLNSMIIDFHLKSQPKYSINIITHYYKIIIIMIDHPLIKRQQQESSDTPSIRLSLLSKFFFIM